jgi:hypothetical protein
MLGKPRHPKAEAVRRRGLPPDPRYGRPPTRGDALARFAPWNLFAMNTDVYKRGTIYLKLRPEHLGGAGVLGKPRAVASRLRNHRYIFTLRADALSVAMRQDSRPITRRLGVQSPAGPVTT